MSSISLSDLATESWKRRHGVAVLVIAVAATGFVGLLWLALPQLMGYWEHTTYDLRQRWQGPAPVDGHVVIISRDEESERDRALGPGLWDRARFAEVITALTQAGARTIALDFHMPATSPPERGNGKSDQALVTSTKSGRVLYPIVTEPEDAAATELTPERQALTRLLPPFPPDIIRLLPQAGRIEGPFPALAAVVAAVGDITAWPDTDGMFRRVPTFIGVGNQAVPTFGIAMAASFLEVAPDHIELVPGEALRFLNAKFPDGHRQTISVPVDAEGRLLIRYAGPWAYHKIPNKRFLEVLNQVRHAGNEAVLREEYSNKLVLLINAGLMSDQRNTPYEASVPGGFILANIANTILTQQAMREASSVAHWGIIFGLSLCAAGTVVYLPGWFGVIGIGVLMGGYSGVAFFAMPLGGLVLPMLGPLASLVIAAILALSWMKGRATDQAKRLEQDYERLKQGLAAKQNLLAQQERQVDQRKAELAAAEQESIAMKRDGQTAQEQKIALLQLDIEALQDQANNTRRVAKEQEEKLVALERTLRGAGEPGQLASVSHRRLAVTRPTILFQAMLTAEELELQRECEDPHKIITCDPGLLSIWKDFRKMAADKYLPILILGEPGTGKELFARAASKLSGLDRKFVSVNMAILGDTAESALFGHEKGAFTGADRQHDGYFLQANNGTLFLDEIGELSLDVQAKLLRALENGEVQRMGAKDSEPIKVKVRVVAATNLDLKQAIKAGKFRADLYSRLCGKVVRLPPLRDRPGDIPRLAQYFVQKEVELRGRSDMALSQGALDRLKAWRPEEGNLRELRQCMARAVVTATGSVITEQDLDFGEAVIAVPNAAVSSVVLPDSEDSISSKGTCGVETVAPVVLDLPPFLSSDGGDDPRTNDGIFLRKVRECHFDVNKTATKLKEDMPILKWDRSTVMHRLKGLCFQALVYTDRNVEAAACSLAGGDLVLKNLATEKVQEYLANLDETIERFSSREEAVTGCQDHFKNLPKRYHKALVSLVRTYSAKFQSISIS